MTEKVQRQTAQIIPFPTKARVSKATQPATSRTVAGPAMRVATVEFGSGWYHDAAMQDAEQARHR